MTLCKQNSAFAKVSSLKNLVLIPDTAKKAIDLFLQQEAVFSVRCASHSTCGPNPPSARHVGVATSFKNVKKWAQMTHGSILDRPSIHEKIIRILVKSYLCLTPELHQVAPARQESHILVPLSRRSSERISIPRKGGLLCSKFKNKNGVRETEKDAH